MKLLILVTSQKDKVDELIEALAMKKIAGATMVDSTGMARVITKGSNSPLLDSLAALLNPSNVGSTTIFMVIKEEQVEVVKSVADQVIGDLSKPDTGILFTLPVDETYGLKTQ